MKSLSRPTSFSSSLPVFILFVLIFAGIGTKALLFSHADSVTCSYHATTSSFSSTFSSATAGSTICLAPGSYGSWSGGTKASNVTITPDLSTGGTAPKAPTPSSTGLSNANGTGTDGNVVFNGINFSGASHITMDGITFNDADMAGSTNNITLTNSIFHGQLLIEDSSMNNANIIINYNMFPADKADCVGGPEGRIWPHGNTHSTPDGVVIENNNIGGVPSVQCDGVQIGGSGVQILNNWFHDFHYKNSAHTDGVQDYGGINEVVKGNFFYNTPDCFVSYDGTNHADIENNICVNDGNQNNGASPNVLGALADKSSIIKHNTLVGFKDTYNNPGGCITLGSKGAASTGTMVTDNVASCFTSDSGGTNASYTENHNLWTNSGPSGTGDVHGNAVYQGGACANFTSTSPPFCPAIWANYLLASSSPGHNAADDGTSMGAFGPGPSTPGGPYGAGGTTGGGGTTTPAPTVSLSASPTSVAAGGGSTLTWSSTNATSCSASSPASWTSSTATSGSQAVTVNAATTYVLTCNGGGGTAQATATVNVKASTPAPTVTISANPTSVVSGSKSTLTWSSTNATSCTASGAWTGSEPTSGTLSVTPSASGTYSLSCTGSGGNGAASTSITVSTPVKDTTPPQASVSAPASGATVAGQVTITAKATDNIAVAHVTVAIDGNQLADLTTSPYSAVWNAAVATNGTHIITVKAYDAADNSTTATETVTVNNKDQAAPSAPGGLKGSAVSSTQVNLSWNASTDNVGVSSYKVERDGAVIGTTTTTSYSDTTAVAGTSYAYTVVAVDAGNNASPASNMVTVTTPTAADKTAPSAPANVKAAAVSSNQITVSWNAATDPSGIKGYNVYRNGTKVGSLVNGTTFGDATVTASTAYSYTVTAVDGASNESVQSTSASVTTPAPPTTQATPVLGVNTIQPGLDYNTGGQAESFAITAQNSGSVNAAALYLNDNNRASKVIVGIYSNSGGQPDKLLTSGSTAQPANGKWNTFKLANSISIKKGTSYWLVVLGVNGQLGFNDGKSGTSQTSRSTSLTALPSNHLAKGSTWRSGPVSAYLFTN